MSSSRSLWPLSRYVDSSTVFAMLGLLFAYQSGGKPALASVLTATANPASISASPQLIDEALVPAAKTGGVGAAHEMPLLTGRIAQGWASLKLAAETNTAITASPVGTSPVGSHRLFTPRASMKFLGMADSSSICPPNGCAPPDMAVAASTSFVMQGVNTSFALYSTAGGLQSGWPKAAQAFFNVPTPSPSGCASSPFLLDPRAFYDPNSNRFWAAILEVEGAFGVNKNCSFVSRYWVAVSQTSNPTGTWFVYSFDMTLRTPNAADYSQIGFDPRAFYFGGNMFNQAGTVYRYDEIFGAKKAAMMAGNAVTAFGFTHLTVGGHFVDTIQPVEVQDAATGPRAGLFINSFNMNGDPAGNDCFSAPCRGVEIWALAHPGTSSNSLTQTFVNTANYVLPPAADEPGCTGCIETLDNRISATPVYHNGAISFALETGASNGTQTVPAILWGQVNVRLSDAGAVTRSTSLLQNGYFDFSGDGSASFGALMPDEEGNLFMVFEFMNSTTNPESAYTSRRVTFAPGKFHDGGVILFAGGSASSQARWGDYEATSYDGRSANNVWIAGEHVSSNTLWATGIGRLSYPLSRP